MNFKKLAAFGVSVFVIGCMTGVYAATPVGTETPPPAGTVNEENGTSNPASPCPPRLRNQECGRLNACSEQMMRAAMNSFFEDEFSFEPPRFVVPVRCPQPSVPARAAFTPNCEVRETKEAYVITLEVPGMQKKDLKISVDDEMLSISGEKKSITREDSDRRIGSDCSYGVFIRSFQLPEGTAADKIKANCKDGLLTISIPKVPLPPKETKTISID